MAAVIRAAGGVLWQPGGPGREPDVCLVHRPRYDDLSLPKGKLTSGEHPLAAAVREVLEETAVRGAPQVRLAPIRYRRGGAPKVVDYWSMRVRERAEFHPNNEVDQVRWLPLSQAMTAVSYPQDVEVLRGFAALPPVTGLVLLIRHADAGKRSRWAGADRLRPLDAAGVAQSRALAELLALFTPDRLVSASPRRCLQTLAPLAERLDLPVEVESVFDEQAAGAAAGPQPGGRMEPGTGDGAPGGGPGGPTADVDRPDGTSGINAGDGPPGVAGPETAGPGIVAAAGRLAQLAKAGPVTVVCSQGAVIAPVLAHLAGAPEPRGYATAKGAGWSLPFGGGRPVAMQRFATGPD